MDEGMNKICTDINQSKKLVELGLDVNTADMFYSRADIALGEMECYPNVLHREEVGDDIPAWSLTALLSLLFQPSLHSTLFNKWRCDYYKGAYLILGEPSDNPIDAVFNSVVGLLENKSKS